ncbi:hypothetical protein LshimejAT787_1300690 [Lyophyllum shimeji]|uniref:Uncharacterized protein n=1 Tax=Lyophyllum shimeji TaxID=47721 RepID=A0A9P3PWA3_LYOSH|nr:hypothetical protein LshimejAT787_1300550 [Lyophyllum shimeji]GLB43168.1 hypothetical protein LshimejAT787_1300690 [Lyophyllum shimeji]
MSSSLNRATFRVVFFATRGGPKVLSIQATRPISSHSYKGKAPYKTGSPEQKQVVDTTYGGAARLGFDAHGAVRAIIAGTFHDHTRGGGPDTQKWITVQMLDANDNILYHKKKDGTEWDRIHLFKDPTLNETEDEMPVAIYTKT